jgi:endonuclease/exonuclease/phosphatase (EEP) superfamily protein YafD
MAVWFVSLTSMVILVVVASVRLLAGDRFVVLIGIAALGPLPYVAAAPVAIGAALRRRFGVLAVALAALLGGLVSAAPFIQARSAVPAAARQAPALRVLSWNLAYGSAAPAAAAAIRRERPDIVMLQEVTSEAVAALEPVLVDYPGRFARPMQNPFGTLIASRTPMHAWGLVPGFAQGVGWAIVGTPRGDIRLVNVHTSNPLGNLRSVWSDQLAAIARFARTPGPPTLLAGDFNADLGNEAFRDLLGDDLTDASTARGQLWAPTWPAKGALPFRLLRLDHVVTTRGLVTTKIRRAGAGGSDHRSLRATVALITAA